MKYRLTTLENGIRVITSERPEIESVSLGVWVKTGSAYEDESVNGISHFLEHMVFKGSAKRNLVQISEDIEDVGGQINAYTSREFTSFYAKMLKNDAELAIDVIGDFLMNPTFPEDELAKEREVVVQEIKQSIDTPDDIIFDHLQSAAFPDQAIGRTILGPAEKVRSFTADTLRRYMQTNYGGENIVIGAVGKINHDDFVRMVSQRFSGMQKNVFFTPSSQNYVGGFSAESRDIEQAHVILGFKTFPYYDKHYYPCMLLSNILGGGTSSRLFQEVREKRGLVYTVYSFANSHTQNGLLGIYASTGQAELPQLLPVVCDEIKKICNDLVDVKELNRAKTQMRAGMLMALESSTSVAEVLARQMLIYGRVLSIQEMIDMIDSVTIDDIRDTAGRIFSSVPCYNLVGAIENKDAPSYEDIKAILAR